jgi:hypothetical protein
MLLAGEHLSASEAKPKPPFAQRQVTLGFHEYVQLEAEKIIGMHSSKRRKPK